MTIFTGFLLMGMSLASTSSDPMDRERMLSARTCAASYRRALNFIKYFPPDSPQLYTYIMYNPKKMGHRGYDLLGDLYYRGCVKADLLPDKEAASTWYSAGAQFHLPESQWKLGKMQYEGDGIEANKDVGLEWLTSAALEGSTDAARYLASLGEPVPFPIMPNTYMVVAAALKQEQDAARTAELQQVFRDLAGLAAVAYVTYSVAKLNDQTTQQVAPTVVPRSHPAAANDICNCKGYGGPGGPCDPSPGGLAYAGPGGPAYNGPGGKCFAGPGGPKYDGPGGPAYDGPGGPAYDGPGGPAYDAPGGPAYSGPGGACYDGPGGPCYSGPSGTENKCPSLCK